MDEVITKHSVKEKMKLAHRIIILEFFLFFAYEFYGPLPTKLKYSIRHFNVLAVITVKIQELIGFYITKLNLYA